MFLKFIVFWLILTIRHISSSDVFSTKFQNCFDTFCLPLDYNKLSRPYEEFGATKVGIDFNISQISEIDDNRFTMTLLMYLGMTWNESRLVRQTDRNYSSIVTIDNRFAKHLWLPDIYIYDLKKILVPSIKVQFAGS